MTPSFTLELIRQLLRWLTIYLVAVGLPEPVARLVEHPDVVAQLAASITIALADGGWLVVKYKQFRAWLHERSFWGN